MKKAFLFLFLAFAIKVDAQLTMPSNGGSTKAMVSEDIGLTKVTINYGRPGVRGREGHIWGEVVHEGFEKDASFGTQRMIPWRAGANENTTIEFSTDVTIEGKSLKAGKYGFFIAYQPAECTLIFSKNTEAWGSYFYDDKADVLRVKVKPVTTKESRERLTYDFTEQTDSTAVIALAWEKLSIPFKVATDLNNLQLASIERELNGTKSFNPMSWYEAASYYADHDIQLENALAYINRAANTMPNFHVLSTKAEILEKLGKNDEAANTLKTAVKAAATPNQANYYAIVMLREKKNEQAFDVFKMNYDHFPNVYVTNMGMARAYSAKGDYKNALKYANKALLQAADDRNKSLAEKNIKTLKEGKDINS